MVSISAVLSSYFQKNDIHVYFQESCRSKDRSSPRTCHVMHRACALWECHELGEDCETAGGARGASWMQFRELKTPVSIQQNSMMIQVRATRKTSLVMVALVARIGNKAKRGQNSMRFRQKHRPASYLATYIFLEMETIKHNSE